MLQIKTIHPTNYRTSVRYIYISRLYAKRNVHYLSEVLIDIRILMNKRNYVYFQVRKLISLLPAAIRPRYE